MAYFKRAEFWYRTPSVNDLGYRKGTASAPPRGVRRSPAAARRETTDDRHDNIRGPLYYHER